MPGCSNTVSVVVLLERDPGHSVFAAPSRHCASLRECFWYILYIIVTPYYMFRLVSLAYYPVVLSAFIWHACDSLLESFPSRQWDETTALDGEERQTNACYNLTQILFATDVACPPVGATMHRSPVSKSRWIKYAELSCLLDPAVPRQWFWG